MRNIDENIHSAFYGNQPYAEGNTTLTFIDGKKMVLLHGNCIYKENNGIAQFTLAGWDTNVTRNRLRALGIDLERKGGKTLYKGAEIESDRWYRV